MEGDIQESDIACAGVESPGETGLGDWDQHQMGSSTKEQGGYTLGK